MKGKYHDLLYLNDLKLEMGCNFNTDFNPTFTVSVGTCKMCLGHSEWKRYNVIPFHGEEL